MNAHEILIETSLERDSLVLDSEKEIPEPEITEEAKNIEKEPAKKLDKITFDARMDSLKKDSNLDANSLKKEFSKTCVTPKSPNFQGPEDNKNKGSTDRNERVKEFYSESSQHLDVSNSTKNIAHQLRKPSGNFAATRGLLQDKASSVTGNQSSDLITAHFHSNRQKSINSNDSPVPDKDILKKRDGLNDPINFLKRFDLLFEVEST